MVHSNCQKLMLKAVVSKSAVMTWQKAIQIRRTGPAYSIKVYTLGIDFAESKSWDVVY